MPEKLNKSVRNCKRKQLCNGNKTNMDKEGSVPKKSQNEGKGVVSSVPKKCKKKSRGASNVPDECKKEDRLVSSVADKCNKQVGRVSSAKKPRIDKRKQPTPKKVAVLHPCKVTKMPSLEKSPKSSSEPENGEKATIEADKKTRGQRKKKIPHSVTIELFPEDEDIDIDYESPSEEYRPPQKIDSDDDACGDSEEDRKTTKKKKRTKVKNESNDEQPKKKRQRKTKLNKSKETLKKTKRIGTGVKRKRRTVNKSKLNTEPETSAFPDMPDLLADDMPMSTNGKPKKKKRRLKSNLAKMRALMDRSASDRDAEAQGAETEAETQEAKIIKPKKVSKYGQPYSVTGSWYIASGYLQDLTTLLQLFDDSENWRFKDFAACWQKLKFSLIYRGRQNFKELLEFSEEVALLTKRFLVPPHSFKWRIGALYTVYGLYYKHPFRHFFKIRLLKNEYQELVEMVNKFRNSADNPDPAFIFRKMEVEGAFQHVATSSEMCLDFFSSERDAVDIKYESQRLANASSVANSLPPENRSIHRRLLEQYMNVKAVAMGDGKEPEKAVRLVQFSLPAEVDSTLKQLKEDTLIELGLKESPSSALNGGKASNVLSDIGARRAHVRAKALTADTSKEYLNKKGIVSKFVYRASMGRSVLKRSPSKSGDEQEDVVVNVNDLLGCVGDELGNGDSTSKSGANSHKVYKTLDSLMDKEVRRFMSLPSANTLSMPLKPRDATKESANDSVCSTEDLDHIGSNDDADNELMADKELVADNEIEADYELEADNEIEADNELVEDNELAADNELVEDNELAADNELAVDPSEQNEVQTLVKNETSHSSNTVQDYGEEWFNTVPNVTPRPRRTRGRPRKTALCRALQNSQRILPLKDKLALLFGDKKEKGRAETLKELLKICSSENELPVINASNSVQVDAPIIDLPSKQTRLILPVNPKSSVDENVTANDLCEAQTKTELAYGTDTDTLRINESVNIDDSFLVLDVHFNKIGTNILRKMKYKIKKNVWESIKKDKNKIKSLKQKLLKCLTPGEEIESSQAVIKIHVSTYVAEGKSGESKLPQGFSPRVVKLKYDSNSSPSQNTTKTKAPINSNIEEEVGSVPSKPKAKRAWIPRTGKRGKMTVVPIKVGGVTHYFPSTPHLKGSHKSEEPITKALEVQTVGTQCDSKVSSEVDDYEVQNSQVSVDSRAESPDFISSDITLMSPLLENETRDDCHPDFVQPAIIHVDAPSPGTDVGIRDEKSDRESDRESPVKLNETLIKKSSLSTRKQQLKRPVDQACVTEDHASIVPGDISPNTQRTTTEPIKDTMCHKVLKNNKIDLPKEENSFHFVNMNISNFTDDMDLSCMSSAQNSDRGSLMSESIAKTGYQDDFSLSQVPLSTSFAFNHNDATQQSSADENYLHSVLKDVQPNPLPCAPVAPLIPQGMTIVPFPLHSRQMQVSHSSVENSKMALSHPQAVVYSSQTPVVLPISNPLAVSNPVISQHFVQHVSTDQGHSSSVLDFQGVPQSSPSKLQSPINQRTLSPTITTTTAMNVNYSNSPPNLLTYKRVPVVYPIKGLPTRFLEDQPTQQSGLEISPKGLEAVTCTPLKSSPRTQAPPSPISSVTYPSLPNVVECNLVRVKINDEIVYLPVDRVLPNTMSINYSPQLARENISSEVIPVEICSASSVSDVQDRDFGVQGPNSGFPSRDSLTNLSPMSILPDHQSVFVSPTVTVPNFNIKTEDVKLFSSDSEAATNEAYASSPSLFRPKKPQVCSFLFSPKYKALSAMRESIGPATGAPVRKEKPRVPFLLKQSLVPKKRKLS